MMTYHSKKYQETKELLIKFKLSELTAEECFDKLKQLGWRDSEALMMIDTMDNASK